MPNIKDLFGNQEQSYKILSATDINALTSSHDAESFGYIEAYQEEDRRFFPAVDYSHPKNFAKYGSAQEYYEASIKRIYRMYPYDGSHKEKIEWHNSSSYLDNYIFDNEYPRTNGYLQFGPNGTWNGGAGGTAVTEGDEIYKIAASPQYVSVKGGPHAASTLDLDDEIKSQAPDFKSKSGQSSYTSPIANIYDPALRRSTNLAMDGGRGNTVEFWVKLASPDADNSDSFVWFDLWNGTGADETAIGSASYGRFFIESRFNTAGNLVDNANFHLTYMSGTDGVSRVPLFRDRLWSILGSSVIDTWWHAAFSVKNSGLSGGDDELEIKTYVDGKLIETYATGTSVGQVTGALNANVGAYRNYPTDAVKTAAIAAGVTDFNGYSSTTGSMDEFRFWKVRRNSQEIGRNWFTQVYGGTNSDDANTTLGVYYKFNEGITGDNDFDAVAIDYSGRISDGTIHNYTSAMRSTESAMVLAKAADSEFKDPILYSFQPEVANLLSDKKGVGYQYDITNNASIINSFPDWIVDDDLEVGGGNLQNLVQIVAQYFDNLQVLMDNLNHLKDIEYTKYCELTATPYADGGSRYNTIASNDPAFSASYSGKPLPFSKNLLSSVGVCVPDIFTDATALEALSSRDDYRIYQEKIFDVKNQIYQNIYNNLNYIYKSKGTEKAFRNLVRCYGVDQDLVKLSLYGDNITHKIKNNFRSVAAKKTYIDFNHLQRFSSTVYQMTSSVGPYSANTNRSYIPRNTALSGGGYALTFETEVLFPKKYPGGSDYEPYNSLTASLFGAYTADPSADMWETTWASPQTTDFQVYAIKDVLESNREYDGDTYFWLTSSALGISLTSSLFDSVYDNEKWNFAVRIKPSKYPWVNAVTGTTETTDTHEVSFYGVQADLDIISNEFNVSASVNNHVASLFVSRDKRIYLGAERTNFTGTLLAQSDVKISSTRVWLDYLTNDEIKAHARDAENHGVLHPYRNAFVFQTNSSPYYIPRSDLLMLEWDFSQVTASNPGGRFPFQDISSGSLEANYAPGITDDRYGRLRTVLRQQFAGRGDLFPANDTNAAQREYIYSAQQIPPEVLNSSDMVNVLERDDVVFTKESLPIEHYIAVEKSMYQTISQEMLKMFATIQNFNTLIGDPVNRYRGQYKDMEKLKSLFYENIENSPDLDKFVDFYKWIDSSITMFLEQLFPASANYAKDMRTLVESHVLERNTYRSKFPTLEMKQEDPESSLLGINELTYNWKYGHSPQAQLQRSTAVDILKGDHTATTGLVNLQINLPTSIGGGGVTLDLVAYNASPGAPGANAIRIYRGTSAAESAVNIIDAINGTTDTTRVTYGSSVAANSTQGIIGISAKPGSTSSKITITVDNPLASGEPIVWTPSGRGPKYWWPAGAIWPPPSSNVGLFTFIISTDGAQETNCLWWNQRAERDGPILSQSVASVNIDRNKILHVATTENSGSYLKRVQGSTYVLRKLSRPYKEGVSIGRQVHGGVNYAKAKNREYYRSKFNEFGANNIINFNKESVITDPEEDCNDNNGLKFKQKLKFEMWPTRGDSTKADAYKGNLISPFNLYLANPPASASAIEDMSTEVAFVNLHSDTYGVSNEIPMQTPFTEKYVGGNQYRHVGLNTSSLTDASTRPEGFVIDYRLESMHGPDYNNLYRPRATHTREPMAKRPLNIKNIRQTTGSTVIGNYEKNYEVVQTSGRRINNKYFVEVEGVGFGEVISGAARPYGGTNEVITDSLFRAATNASTPVSLAHFPWDGSQFKLSFTFTAAAAVGAQLGIGFIGGSDYIVFIAVDDGAHGDGDNISGFNYAFQRGDSSGTPTTAVADHLNTAIARVLLTMTLPSLKALTVSVASATVTLVQDINQTTLAASPETPFFMEGQPYVSGNYNFTLPDRTNYDTIFVERFSAPGSFEVLSRGYMDPFAEEYSPYNALPFRNWTVRGPRFKKLASPRVGVSASIWSTGSLGLQSLLTRHCGWGGYDYELQTTGAYQKTNRNRLRMMESSSAGYSTGSQFDNWWVQHPIPRSDFNYSWITASVMSTNPSNAFGFGYFPADGMVSSSAGGFQSAVNFCSASDIGSYDSGGPDITYAVQKGVSVSDFLVNDFIGLNSNIYEPITSSDNYLGYPLGLFAGRSAGVVYNSFPYQGGLINSNTVPAPPLLGGLALVLNGLLHHRNGPYGWPSWKQIRAGQTAVPRHHKKNNTFSISVRDAPQPWGLTVFPKMGGMSPLVRAGFDLSYKGLENASHKITNPKAISLECYTEPLITSKYFPMRHRLDTVDDNALSELVIDHTYTNNLARFANPHLDSRIQFGLGVQGAPEQVYDQLTNMYLDTTLPATSNPIKAFRNLVYKEGVYPKAQNTYLAKTRGRTKYTETPEVIQGSSYIKPLGQQRTFWKDNLADRQRTGDVAHNALDYVIRSTNDLFPPYLGGLEYPRASDLSIWPLDVGSRYLADDNACSRLSGSNHGQLSLNNTTVSLVLVESGAVGAVPTASFNYEYWNDILFKLPSNTPASFPRQSGDSIYSPLIPDWETAKLSGKNPWFNSYEDYAQDIRCFGKEYTVLPEFKISDHIDYYLNLENFQAKNNKFLSLEGGALSQSAASPSASFDNDFFNEYCHSDFLKHFEVVQERHEKVGIPTTQMTIKCHGIKKLLPYDGFYPMLRTVQLGSLFSQSFAPYLIGSNNYSSDPTTERLASIMQPFFNPGILYNTIKSGLAVDWMAFTGTVGPAMADTGSVFLESGSISSSFRFPFESLVDPGAYLPTFSFTGSTSIKDAALYYADTSNWWGEAAVLPSGITGPHHITGAYGVWRGNQKLNYTMAMQNFLGESARFFLKGSKFKNIISGPEQKIKPFISGVTYYMDLVCYKTDDMIMYEGPQHLQTTAPLGSLSRQARGMHYGPLCQVTGSPPGSEDNAAYLDNLLGKYRYDPGFAPYTPPYFYGKSVSTFAFKPHEARWLDPFQETHDFNLDDITGYLRDQGTVHYNEFNYDSSGILLDSIVGSTRDGVVPRGVEADTFRDSALAARTQMNNASSFNMFDIVHVPKVDFNPQTGAPLATNTNVEKYWNISPKFECPVLNFSGTDTTVTGVFPPAGGGYDINTRGMWRGYGTTPRDGQGIFFEVKESFPTYTYAASAAPTHKTIGGKPYDIPLSASLLQQLGFRSGMKQRIGEVSDTREIFEAVVAIPFKNVANQKAFFPILSADDPVMKKVLSRRVVEALLGNDEPLDSEIYTPGPSIVNMVETMQKYIFPPKLDFIANKNVTPFCMYIFEFGHTLDKQDLNDIWQGVMPQISLQAEKATATISHFLTNNELLGAGPIAKDLRWLVFKVKQKAEKSYYNVTVSTSDDDKFRFDFDIGESNSSVTVPKYSYNWPYDFFSLVELAKIDTAVQIGGNVPFTPPDITDKFEPVPFGAVKLPAQGGPKMAIPAGAILVDDSGQGAPGYPAGQIPPGLDITKIGNIVAGQPSPMMGAGSQMSQALKQGGGLGQTSKGLKTSGKNMGNYGSTTKKGDI